MEAYNLASPFIPANPATRITSSSFGRLTYPANRGREMQHNLRLHF